MPTTTQTTMPTQMPIATLAAANWFLLRLKEARERDATQPDTAWRDAQSKLHKLLALAHGWNLAIHNQALLEETAIAADHGPCFATLHGHISRHGLAEHGLYSGLLVDPHSGKPFGSQIDRPSWMLMDKIWEKYGRLNVQDLARIYQHPGTPWWIAYMKRGRDSVMDDAEVQAFHVALALAGRDMRYANDLQITQETGTHETGTHGH